MAFLGLDDNQRKQVELEVIPKRARLQLTRLLRYAVDSNDANTHIARINNVVNIARNAIGLPISIIEATGFGDYEYVDGGWLRAELEVAMRRPDTPDLIETLADLIQEGWLERGEVNGILAAHGCAMSFHQYAGDFSIEVAAVEEIAADERAEIPNIRLLINRMETALENKDCAGVLHASACVFETLAKDVIPNPAVENQTLASFFDRYRKDSKLPEPILDYILEVYKKRNTEPLAAHGQTTPPTVTHDEAVILLEMTKAFVRIERRLAVVNLSPTKKK